VSLFDLSGKTAVVTGANGGIGQGIALALANAGADIVAVGRSDTSETAAQVKAAGRKFKSIRADLSSTEPVKEIVEETVAWSGHIDILVNNSGIIRRTDSIDFSEQDWDEVMNVNLKSAFFLAQATARRMIAQGGGGKIINIASMLSFQGGVNIVAYTASKHGVAGFTKALANEWAKERININAIAPGYIATENTKPLREDAKRNQAILDRIPEGRWGRPEDIAGGCVFLASPEADYLNGAVINIDGGWLGR